MGWYYPHGYSRKQLIEELTRGGANAGVISKCLRHCVRGNVLWTVRETQRIDMTTRFIGCDLMQNSDIGWGYKPMDESMGPYYYSCPLSYLDMVPFVANGEWRKIVREHHQRIKERRNKIMKS